MLVIRLQRTGRENMPTYRIVVAEKAKPVKGKFQEIVGQFLPSREPAIFEYKEERILHWIKMGALPSNTVARLLKKNGMKNMEKYTETYTKKRGKKEPPPAPAAAPLPSAPVAEAPSAPAEEKPAEAPQDSGDTTPKEA